MGGDLRMGSWGSRLCENDTALDVIDDIESIFSEDTDNKAYTLLPQNLLQYD